MSFRSVPGSFGNMGWPFGCSVPAMQLVMRCNALLSLYSALKSASFSSGLAMMARFSFLFFQTKSWSANRVRLMTDLGGCEQRFDLRLYQIFLSGFKLKITHL